MRLDRLLGLLGIASRSGARDMIRQGRVQVDGVIVRDNAANVEEGCDLIVDGVQVDTRLERHVMMNKPVGVLTAARDTRAATVLDLLPPVYRACGCMPVGRLDKDTEGLLLFTTDGQMAHRLLAPSSQVEKEYVAQVTGQLTPQDVQAFAQGIELKDFTALPARLTILSAQAEQSIARVVVTEGKFHQVRRMFAARDHEVTALQRVRFGPLLLDAGLAPGQHRELSTEEVQLLLESVGRK
ncbi:MAG: pseudouridine synthase [Christensenellales bacterium]